jgi:hypothetical protein
MVRPSGAIPLRPDYSAARGRDNWQRTFLAVARAGIDQYQRGAVRLAEEMWNDPQTHLTVKAATAPADSVTSGWASQFGGSLVGSFAASLQQQSALFRLIAAGMQVDLTGIKSVLIPRRQGGPKPVGSIPWVAEGAPAPLRQIVLETVELGPLRRVEAIIPLTRELVERSDAENALGTAVREDLVASVDSTAFSTNTGAAQPSGLLAGVTPNTASSATAKTDAMLEDLENLAGKIADAGGSGNVVYIMNPKQFVSAKLRLRQLGEQITIWPCASLTAKTVAAIEPLAFASTLGSVPRVELSNQAVLHMETSPAQVSTVGSPNVVAAGLRSLFQTDTVALKVIIEINWVMRQSGMVAVVNNVIWGAP